MSPKPKRTSRLKIAAYIVAAILGLWLLLNLTVGLNFLSYRTWAPLFRDAQRQVFERSQSFVQGKVTHLNRLRMTYESAEDGLRRDAVRRLILSEAATVHPEDLPADLRSFLAGLR